MLELFCAAAFVVGVIVGALCVVAMRRATVDRRAEVTRVLDVAVRAVFGSSRYREIHAHIRAKGGRIGKQERLSLTREACALADSELARLGFGLEDVLSPMELDVMVSRVVDATKAELLEVRQIDEGWFGREVK